MTKGHFLFCCSYVTTTLVGRREEKELFFKREVPTLWTQKKPGRRKCPHHSHTIKCKHMQHLQIISNYINFKEKVQKQPW
jgi:hypothetical protein